MSGKGGTKEMSCEGAVIPERSWKWRTVRRGKKNWYSRKYRSRTHKGRLRSEKVHYS